MRCGDTRRQLFFLKVYTSESIFLEDHFKVAEIEKQQREIVRTVYAPTRVSGIENCRA